VALHLVHCSVEMQGLELLHVRFLAVYQFVVDPFPINITGVHEYSTALIYMSIYEQVYIHIYIHIPHVNVS